MDEFYARLFAAAPFAVAAAAMIEGAESASLESAA
jgi:hypothetical protein